MTTPLFPNVIGWNLLDGGTDAQDGNNYPGPLLQEYAAAVVGASGYINAGAFGASPTAGADENTVAINKALAAGGEVAVSVPGTYKVRTLVIPSFTRFTLAAGVKLQRDSAVNKPMLMNAFCGYIWLASMFVRASNVVTVSEPYSTRTVGEQVFITNSPDTSFNGVVTVLSSSDSGWTYASSGSNGAAGTSTYYCSIIPVTKLLSGAQMVRASNVVTVNEPGHKHKSGDVVYIGCANASTFSGLVKVGRVYADYWTYSKTGADGAAADPHVFNYDKEIIVSGPGVIDGNRPNNTTATNSILQCPIYLGLVSGVTIDLPVGGTIMRAVNMNNCANVYLDDGFSPFDCLVGTQIEGGCFGFSSGDISGQSQFYDTTAQKADDFLAFTGTAFASGAGGNYDNTISPYGLMKFSGIKTGILRPKNSLNCLKLTAHSSAVFEDVEVTVDGDIQDSSPLLSTGAGISILEDGPGLVGTTINSLVVKGLKWATPGQGYAQGKGISISGTTIDIKSMRVENAAMGGCPIILNLVSGTIRKAVFVGAYYPFGTSAATQLVNQVAGTIENLHIESARYITNTNVVYQASGGTIKSLYFDSIDLTSLSDFVGTVIDSVGTINSVHFNGVKSDPTVGNRIATLLRYQKTSLNSFITLNSCDITASSCISDNGTSTGTKTMLMVASRWDGQAGGRLLQFTTAGGVIDFTGYGCNFPSQKVMNTGATYRINCLQAQVDVTAVARVDGYQVYNTNTAAGTLGVAGLVTCQGTAANSWKLMSNPSGAAY